MTMLVGVIQRSHNVEGIYENIVFVELIRRGKDIYYWKSPQNFEVDFVIREGKRITEIIQVCADISKKETQTRKVRGALEGASESNLKKAYIITEDFSGEIIEKGVKISFIPLWQWLIIN